MTNRRQFLQCGLTASTLAGCGMPLFAAPTAGDSVVPLYKFIYDLRHAASVAMADRIAIELGRRNLYAMRGDITPFWRDELQQVWQRQPLAVAGLTETGPLFCLQQLAPHYGLQVLWQQPLADDKDGAALVSWLIAPAARRGGLTGA